MDKSFFTIDELESVTGIPKRTIKFYIQKSIVPPPVGRGRGAGYTLEHLQALENIQKLQADGYSIARIQEMKRQTDSTMVQARPRGVAVTRTEIGLMPGVFLSFVHEICPFDSETMTEVTEKVSQILNEELSNKKPKETK